MDPTTYKLIHLVGLAIFCYAFGGFDGSAQEDPKRKRYGMFPGIGLFLTLLGGFGMLAKDKTIGHTEWWLIYKVAVWLCLGASIVIFKRKPDLATPMKAVLALLMLGAAYLGLFHRYL